MGITPLLWIGVWESLAGLALLAGTARLKCRPREARILQVSLLWTGLVAALTALVALPVGVGLLDRAVPEARASLLPAVLLLPAGSLLGAWALALSSKQASR